MAKEKWTINDAKLDINELAEKLVYANHDVLISRLQDLNKTIPKSMHRTILLTGLKSEFEREKKRLLDEEKALGHSLELASDRRLARLKNYELLPESLLVKEFFTLQNPPLVEAYMHQLWKRVLKALSEEEIEERFLTLMLEESLEKVHDELPHLKGFYDKLSVLLKDASNEIDGVDFETFQTRVSAILTVPELQTIGKRYGVTVTKTMKKERLKFKMQAALIEKKEWDDTLKERFETATLKDLEDINSFYKLDVSPYLTKEQMAENITESLLVDDEAHLELLQEKPVIQEEITGVTRVEYLALLDEINALKQRLPSEDLEGNKTHVQTHRRRYVATYAVDALALFVLAFMFFGTVTYFLDNLTVVESLNQSLDQVTLRGVGIMSLYHSVLDFFINGVG